MSAFRLQSAAQQGMGGITLLEQVFFLNQVG